MKQPAQSLELRTLTVVLRTLPLLLYFGYHYSYHDYQYSCTVLKSTAAGIKSLRFGIRKMLYSSVKGGIDMTTQSRRQSKFKAEIKKEQGCFSCR